MIESDRVYSISVVPQCAQLQVPTKVPAVPATIPAKPAKIQTATVPARTVKVPKVAEEAAGHWHLEGKWR